MEQPPGPAKDLRRTLIDAARQILDEPDTSLDLRKVADRVGKSRTAPYLVFGRTEEGGGLRALRLAAAASGIGELLVEIETVLSSGADPEEVLQQVGTVYIGFARRHPRLFRLMFGPEVALAMAARGEAEAVTEVREVVQARGELERLMREIIEACQQVGAMAAGDPYPLVMGAWAIFHGAAMLLLDGQLEIAGVASSSDQAARFATRFLLENPSVVVAEAAVALARAQAEKGGGGDADRPWQRLQESPSVHFAADPELYSSESVFRERAAPPLPPAPQSAGGPPEPRHPSGGPPAAAWASAPPPPPAPRARAGAPAPPPRPSSPMFDLIGAAADSSGDDYAAELDPAESDALHLAEPAFRGAALEQPRPPAPDLSVVREVLSISAALRRARRMQGVLKGSRVLWIDDRPALTGAEQSTLESLGVEVIRASDTIPALELLGPGRAGRRGPPFDVILSDIARPDSRTAGVDALPLIRQLAPDTPVIFYVEWSEPRAYTPHGAFGITNDPEELLHLLLDVLERKRM